jgi:sulfite reductase (NADPH) flavoprotein alpha-component
MSDHADTAVANAYSKDNPFPAIVTENRLLNGPGSLKETRHIVVSIAGSGLHYKAGDSLGVFSSNRPSEVEALLAATGARGDEPVLLPKAAGPVAFREALVSRLALAGPTRRLVETLQSKAGSPAEAAKLAGLLAAESKDLLASWLDEREFVDLLEEFPSARLQPQELVDHMRKLMPRLYSIASSPRMHPQEIHLTVAIVRYETNRRDRVGVCTTFLADRVAVGSTPTPVFVSHSHFGPPENGEIDAIMVGPGTGIAPFRAFLQDRASSGARGRNWIFFGDQKRATDFLYEEDWNGWRSGGILTRLDTAFSRDQLDKVYVQDRMRENAAELWSWIKGGGHFYVCGDAKRMAKDVDVALHDVIAGQGGMNPAQAADYVKLMKKEKRYQRDVY